MPVVAEKAVLSRAHTVSQRPATAQRVKFAVVATTLHSIPWPKVPDITLVLPIPDFCSMLCQICANDNSKKYLGSILDEPSASCRYCFYLLEKHEKDMETQSLRDMLSSSLHPMGSHIGLLTCFFSRRDRLFLAAIIASNVLQFHGTWLKSYWRSRDILFP
jgi:hypothetical protein